MISLVDEAEDLRLRLVELIYQLKTFDEHEITKAFKDATGRESLGLGRTIRQFLSDLTEHGVLECEDSRYQVR